MRALEYLMTMLLMLMTPFGPSGLCLGRSGHSRSVLYVLDGGAGIGVERLGGGGAKAELARRRTSRPCGSGSGGFVGCLGGCDSRVRLALDGGGSERRRGFGVRGEGSVMRPSCDEW